MLPVDGDPQFLKDTAYPVARLYASLGALRAKRVLVVLDSCFSGAGGRSVLPPGARPLVTKLRQDAVPAKVAALTASGATQISGVIEEQGHGAFTYFFLKGLSEGRRSARKILEYAEPLVQDEARRQNRDQTPALAGADGPL